MQLILLSYGTAATNNFYDQRLFRELSRAANYQFKILKLSRVCTSPVHSEAMVSHDRSTT